MLLKAQEVNKLFTIPLTADRAFHCSVSLPLTLPPNLLKSADLNCICVLNKLRITFPDPFRLIVKFDLCNFQNKLSIIFIRRFRLLKYRNKEY